MPGMWRLNGHLGSSVSALVDGQLDPHEAERAWAHVMTCPPCRRLVEREGWVKRQLAEIAGTEPVLPPPGLLGSLHGLRPEPHDHAAHEAHAARAAWAAVHALEDRSRSRRRVGIAAAGVGSVSAAVLGLSSLSGATLDIGGVPSGAPSSETRPAPGGSDGTAPTDERAPSPEPSPFSGWLGGDTSDQGTRTVPIRLIG